MNPITPTFLKAKTKMRQNTPTAMDKVMFASADGTTLKYGTPIAFAISGKRSIGKRSIRFMRKIHINTVKDRGAISLLLRLKIPVTELWTNSKISSTKHCNLFGTPLVVFLAAYLNSKRKTMPKTAVIPIESRLIV